MKPRLEDTHPELAKFIMELPSRGVVEIRRGCFYNAAGSIIAMSKEPGRNSPCPCGSGEKYKKCCKRG